MAPKKRVLSIETHIGLGNAAKSMGARLYNAYRETTDSHLRSAIERLAGALKIFKHAMAFDVMNRIPILEDPKNLAGRLYLSEKLTTDAEATELYRLENEAPNAGYGTIVWPPTDERK